LNNLGKMLLNNFLFRKIHAINFAAPNRAQSCPSTALICKITILRQPAQPIYPGKK